MVDSNQITIEDLVLDKTSGSPFTFPAKFSDKKLCGIELDFRVNNDDLFTYTEQVFKRDTVQINDPFTEREYMARVFIKSQGYQNNEPGGFYTAQVNELEIPPEVNELEIDNHRFEALKYTEKYDKDYGVIRHALLKLSESQFAQFPKEDKFVSIVRVGVDKTPLNLEIRGMGWWSKHKGESETYYKRLVDLYIPMSGEEAEKTLHFTDLIVARFHSLYSVIAALNDQQKLLTRILADKSIITQDEVNKLFGDNWKPLDELDELTLAYSRVTDAQDLFD